MVRLTIAQAWTLLNLNIRLKCTAQEVAAANVPDSTQLSENEFEAYLLESCGMEGLDVFTTTDNASKPAWLSEPVQNKIDDLLGLLTCPRLLRLPTKGAMGIPLALKGPGRRLGCDASTICFFFCSLASCV